MIKIALKHWIIEVCIEHLFNNIKRNFTFLNNTNNISEGFYYKIYVITKFSPNYFVLHQCTVERKGVDLYSVYMNMITEYSNHDEFVGDERYADRENMWTLSKDMIIGTIK